jgi:hypothetical protein
MRRTLSQSGFVWKAEDDFILLKTGSDTFISFRRVTTKKGVPMIVMKPLTVNDEGEWLAGIPTWFGVQDFELFAKKLEALTRPSPPVDLRDLKKEAKK